MFDKEEIIKNLNPADGVDISTVLPEIMPQRYYILEMEGPIFSLNVKINQ